MSISTTYLIGDVPTVAQPVSPDDGDTYVIGPSATGTDWAGNDGLIATWSDDLGWILLRPKVGDRILVNSGVNLSALYTPSTASPASTWVRNSQFLVTGGGTSSSNLTTTFATLTEFSSPEKIDLIGSYGCFNWGGNGDGQMTLDRDVYGVLKIRASFSIFQTAAGNQNTFTIKLQKDSGSGFSDVPGTVLMGNTFADTSMWGQAVTIIYSDSGATDGDVYRFQGRVESDSATNLMRVENMVIEMEERNP